MTSMWLDDLRLPPEGWAWVKTAREALELLETGRVERVSLDHDLGEEGSPGTGYDVASWIEEAAYHGRIPRLAWTIHSANPVGREQMVRALRSADRFWARHE